MTVTTLRRRKDRMYGVVASGSDYYAFWADGRAGLYIDGSFVSYRDTGGPTIAEAPSLIHTDSEAIVGPGAIVTRVDEENLQVWDVEGAVTYEYAVPAGWVCSPAIYADGYLWWIEREAVQHGGIDTHATYFRLRQSRTDLLTDLATVYTYEALHQFGFSVAWSTPTGIALTAAALIIQNFWIDNETSEVADDFNVRITKNGSGATDSGWYAIGTGAYIDPWSFRVAPVTSGGIAAGGAGGFLAGQADDPEASPVAFWSGVEWQLGEFVELRSSVSADGTEGGLFDGADFVRGPAAAGTPTGRFTVGVSPAADVPDYFFIKG